MLLCTYQHLVYICTILCVLMIILSFVFFCSAIAFTFNYSYHGMHIPSVAQVALQFLQNRVLRYIIFKGSRKFYEECGDEICQWQQKVGLGYGCLGGLLVQTFHSNMVKKNKKKLCAHLLLNWLQLFLVVLGTQEAYSCVIIVLWLVS